MPSRKIAADDIPVISQPLKKIWPEEGAIAPVIRLKNVVLPAPLGPMMDRISPFATRKLTPLTAARPPKRRDRFSVRNTSYDCFTNCSQPVFPHGSRSAFAFSTSFTNSA